MPTLKRVRWACSVEWKGRQVYNVSMGTRGMTREEGLNSDQITASMRNLGVVQRKWKKKRKEIDEKRRDDKKI